MNNTDEKPAVGIAGPKPKPRFYLETYGCQMNVYDSELVRSILFESGYGETDVPEGADVDRRALAAKHRRQGPPSSSCRACWRWP